MARKYMQGIYKPKNPEKYSGNADNICYRSSYELAVFRWLDNTDNVIHWASEETVIPYISPVDMKWHRYFCDLHFEIVDADGKHRRILCEIKPFNQTKPPMLKEGKKPTKSHLEAQKTWAVNQAKWKAALQYCKKNQLEFTILTEREIFGTKST